VNLRFPHARILVFARAPVPGRAKTRLIPVLGARGAAELHRRLVQRTVTTAVRSRLAPVELWCAPDCSHPALVEMAALGVALHPQTGADLGERMQNALDSALARADRAVLVGSDCPAMTGGYLAQALAALARHDAVIGPAEDGGYVLAGTRIRRMVLGRGVAWGTPRVLEQTRSLFRAQGVDWCELPRLWDVDREGDLERLRVLAPGLLGEAPVRSRPAGAGPVAWQAAEKQPAGAGHGCPARGSVAQATDSS